MIPECDFICVVCNLSSETKDIISNDQFALMKDSAILCNVSRGATVNQDALYDALNTNSIYGAALDVTTPEPLPRDHKLLKCKNLIITPHWGTNTKTAVMEILGIAIDNINSALRNVRMVSEVLWVPIQGDLGNKILSRFWLWCYIVYGNMINFW